MNPLVDTHTHLYLEDFDGEQDVVVGRAIESGVAQMIFPNVDLSTIEPMKALAGKFPDNIRMAMGFHPTEVKEGWAEQVESVMQEASSEQYVAIGEIGIDLYWDKTYEEAQMQAFARQIALAQQKDIPIIIHCRDGLDQTLEVLRGFPGVKGVFHSFGGAPKDVDRIRNIGDFYFGINGIVTFKNCKVRESLEEITLERVLLETDAPYLAPVPHRGKRNESAYIVDTAAYISNYLNIDIDELAQATTSNAKALFAI